MRSLVRFSIREGCNLIYVQYYWLLRDNGIVEIRFETLLEIQVGIQDDRLDKVSGKQQWRTTMSG